MELYDEALALFEELGHSWLIAAVQQNRGYVALRRADLSRAAVCFRGALAIWREAGDLVSQATSLAGFAGLAVLQGQWAAAARLLAASSTLMQEHGARITLAPADQLEFDRYVADVRAGLDADAFALAWEQGQSLLLEEALAEALRIGEPLAPPDPMTA
jgi:hypothetical protein